MGIDWNVWEITGLKFIYKGHLLILYLPCHMQYEWKQTESPQLACTAKL